MARTAIYIHAIVQPGHRIDVAAPAGIEEGDSVGVVILADQRSTAVPRTSLAEVLDSLPKDIGLFSTAQDADAYVREERNSWE